MAIRISEEEIHALIEFQEAMRDDAIGSCEDEEAERRRQRIKQWRKLLVETVGDR